MRTQTLQIEVRRSGVYRFGTGELLSEDVAGFLAHREYKLENGVGILRAPAKRGKLCRCKDCKYFISGETVSSWCLLHSEEADPSAPACTSFRMKNENE